MGGPPGTPREKRRVGIQIAGEYLELYVEGDEGAVLRRTAVVRDRIARMRHAQPKLSGRKAAVLAALALSDEVVEAGDRIASLLERIEGALAKNGEPEETDNRGA